LARRLASLASETVDGDADRAGDGLLVVDHGTQPLGDLERAAEPLGRTRTSKERLVEGDRLDERGDPTEGLHHRPGHGGEVVVVGRDHHACGHSRRARVPGMPDRTPYWRAR
jgi:hypothetical protein